MRNVWLLALSLLWTLFLFSTSASESEENAILVDFTSDLNVDNQSDQRRIILTTKALLSNVSLFFSRVINLPFQSVTFLVPNSWNISELEESFNSTRNAALHEKSSNANISIISSGAFKVPVSTQYQGCGQQGRRITIPLDFLRENGNPLEREKVFAREWIKYRYGVFDENGFPNDRMFPEYYKIAGDEDVRITDCPNIAVNYTYRDNEERSCNLSINSTTGLPDPNSACRTRILPEFNTDVLTSFFDRNMNKLPNVNGICDGEHFLHNSLSPNKHNLFCNGKSIAEVIKRHPDFKSKRSFPENLEPKFHIVKKQSLRVAIAIEITEKLKILENVIRNAVKSLIYLLPNGSQYNFITFTNKIVSQSQSFVIENDENQRFLPLLVYRGNYEQSEVAIKEVIEKAAEELLPSNEPQTGILVVATSVPPPHFDPSVLKKLCFLCLYVLSIDENVAKKWGEFLQENNLCTGGSKVTHIVDNSFTTFKNLISDMDSLMDEEMENSHILVKTTELDHSSPLSFTTDDKVDYFDITLTNNQPTMDVMASDFNLTQCEEACKSFQPFAFVEDRDFVIFRIPMENKKASEWTLQFDEPNIKLLAQVITKQLHKSVIPSPKLKIWFESENANYESYQEPIILYAELLSGSCPVINGAVTAVITTPDGERKIIKLHDNGIGDPDITKGDGIYSRYFIQFSDKIGEYKVTITASDNNRSASIGIKSSIDFCCGSEIKYNIWKSTGIFDVTADITFKVNKKRPPIGYEPSQIRDLRVWQTEKPSIYSFTWTSPGSEKDHGIAEYYELKCFTSQEDAYRFTNEVWTKNFNVSYLHTMQTYRSSEFLEFDLSEVLAIKVNNSRLFYVALCARNAQNLRSKVSNVGTIFVSDQWPTGATDEGDSTTESFKPVSASYSDTEKIAIAVGTATILMVLFGLGFVLFFCYKDRGKSKKKNESIQPKPRISDIPSNSHTNAKVNDWMTTSEPISPVTSVPAKVLLYHHEQVKDAKTKKKEPPLFTLNTLNSFKNEAYAEDETNKTNKCNNDSDSQDSSYDNITDNFECEVQPVQNEDLHHTSHQLYAKPFKKRQTEV